VRRDREFDRLEGAYSSTLMYCFAGTVKGETMLTISRREFLILGTLLGARAIGATNTRPFFRRTGLPIGLQLYTVGDDLKRVSMIGVRRSSAYS
jgi:hypothetical protein